MNDISNNVFTEGASDNFLVYLIDFQQIYCKLRIKLHSETENTQQKEVHL